MDPRRGLSTRCWLCCCHAGRRRPAAAAEAHCRGCCCWATASFAGYGLPRPDAFPARLQAALKSSRQSAVTLIEAGVSGDTTAGGLARLPWVLGGSPQQQPDAALVELGGNDVLRGFAPHTVEPISIAS